MTDSKGDSEFVALTGQGKAILTLISLFAVGPVTLILIF